MPGAHARGHDAMLLECFAPARAAAIGLRAHSCFHWRVLGSNFIMRVLPVSPKIRTAYCASRRLRMYTVPDEAVPSAEKLAMLPDPNRIGSVPGAVPLGSTGGSPGIAPNSTPVN